METHILEQMINELAAKLANESIKSAQTTATAEHLNRQLEQVTHELNGIKTVISSNEELQQLYDKTKQENEAQFDV